MIYERFKKQYSETKEWLYEILGLSGDIVAREYLKDIKQSYLSCIDGMIEEEKSTIDNCDKDEKAGNFKELNENKMGMLKGMLFSATMNIQKLSKERKLIDNHE